MKHNIGKSILLLGTAVLSLTGVAGCSPSTQNDKNVLNIVFLNLGYGRDWIDELAKIWEAKNPGYTIHLEAESSAVALTQKHLYSKDNIDDLYIDNSRSWKTYALKDKFLALDDFLEDTVDGMKIKEKVNDEYHKSLSFNGHTYRLPWTSGVPGIYYNAKMFKENGWEVPQTYDELVALCKTIKDAKVGVGSGGKATTTVAPFVFTGENMDYFDYAVFTWWAQLAGLENVKNYLKYENSANFSKDNPAFVALGKALQMWWNIFKDPTNYVKGSDGWKNHLAQQSFYNGYSAMMINCDWLYNETLQYTDTGKLRDGFELKIMNTPAANDAVSTHISYIVGEDQFIAIPKSSVKADLAKSFIKLMISDEGIKTFAEKAHGTLAYKSTVKLTTDDAYTNSLFDYLDNATERFTNWSDSKLFLNNVIDVWTTNDLAPYTRIFNSSAADPVAAYITEVSNNANDKWNEWQKKAGQ